MKRRKIREWEKFVNDVLGTNFKNSEVKGVMRKAPIICDTKEPESVKIMVITEQPVHSKEDDDTKEKKCEHYFRTPCNTPNCINEIFEGKFRKSIVEEKGPFYWTHVIKYPLLKKEKKDNPGKLSTEIRSELSKRNTCFLRNEIKILRPKFIIAFGNTAFFILRKLITENNLFESDTCFLLNTKISELIKHYNKTLGWDTKYYQNRKPVRIIVLPHPSGANPSFKQIFKSKKINVLQELRSII